MTSSLRLGITLPAAVLAGWFLSLAQAPLPWMIGPLLVCAVANSLHARIQVPFAARAGGQWLVGAAFGLYFSAPVLAQLAGLAGWIALAIVLSLAIGMSCALVLGRLGRADPATAFFASAIGGAAEMANLAERHGARVDQVAAAQAMRVLMVVLIVPFAFKLGGWQGTDAHTATQVALNAPGLLLLLGGGALAGALFTRLGVPNAWLFGPLLTSALLTAFGHPLSAVPAWLVNLGQLLIGCSLGARFAPEFFRDTPRFMYGVIVSTTLMLLGCTLGGGLIALLSGIPMPTAILATAPGGLAEMGLTAQVLQLGVPVVTAFHTTRLTVAVLSAGPVFRWLSRRATRPPGPY